MMFRTPFLLLFATLLLTAHAAEIVPKGRLVLDNDGKPSTPLAVCKSLTGDSRPKVVSAAEDGDSIFCTVGDGNPDDNSSQHSGSIAMGCPVNSRENASGRCECAPSFRSTGSKCVEGPEVATQTEQRLPNQTCSNTVLARLQGEKDALVAQIPRRSPLDTGNPKKAARLPCSYVKGRLDLMSRLKNKRQEIQNVCFGGKPDAAHQEQLDNLDNAVSNYEALKRQNCAPGHPMENL